MCWLICSIDFFHTWYYSTVFCVCSAWSEDGWAIWKGSCTLCSQWNNGKLDWRLTIRFWYDCNNLYHCRFAVVKVSSICICRHVFDVSSEAGCTTRTFIIFGLYCHFYLPILLCSVLSALQSCLLWLTTRVSDSQCLAPKDLFIFVHSLLSLLKRIKPSDWSRVLDEDYIRQMCRVEISTDLFAVTQYSD